MVIYAVTLLDLCVIFFRVGMLNRHNPSLTAFMKAHLSDCASFFLGSEDCRVEKSWKPLNEIAPLLQQAILMGEDPRFFSHHGIDPEAIRFSLETNWNEKRIARGASTLTQQLVKNLYLSPSKNPFRKLKEIVIALFMERVLTKNRILEIYLNVVEWGEGIYGTEAASLHYFKKHANDLTREEAVYLATILPNPKLYTQPAYAAKAEKRRSRIVRMLHEINAI
ncbi:MAG: monofunctional biosynthetic peptidoglycan transglycosylase [bacterium]